MRYALRMSGLQHRELRRHLYPGDDRESVSLALCGRRSAADQHVLLVHRLIHVPVDQCPVRTSTRITWNTDVLAGLISDADQKGLALLKIHSHPTGYGEFSSCDDQSDRELFESLFGWTDSDLCHGSAVMLPDGRMFGRVALPGGRFHRLDRIAVAGDDLQFWDTDRPGDGLDVEAMLRNRQVFGKGTIRLLARLCVAVVGYSGTGSIVVEQLARLGVGRLIIIDPDHSELKNLNRILNARRQDAIDNRLKVDIALRAIEVMGLGTAVEVFAKNLIDPDVVRVAAGADVVFGCTDSIEARHVLNRLSTYYDLPYFDVGIRLDADGKGGIDQVCGSAHYVQPGGSSLLSRGVYTMQDVSAEALRRSDRSRYDALVAEKYIKGVQVDRPAVISVNSHIASLAVNDFLARLHPFRLDDNREFAVQTVSLSQGEYLKFPDGEPCAVLAGRVGLGDRAPLLDMPALSGVAA